MNTWFSQKSRALRGDVRVAGDKSISHRAVMLAALAEGRSQIHGFLEGEDCLATLAAFRQMGVQIERPAPGRLCIYGRGKSALRAAAAPLDMGNSGTAMRLMAGLLAGQNFSSVLVGDASLSQRPMRRVTEPLNLMGAAIETSPAGTAPLRIQGSALQAIEYRLPVASAQLKSALLLAGLYARGTMDIEEIAPSRDHSERMLQAFGVQLERDGAHIRMAGGQDLQACSIQVPADVSSAAFFMVAALIHPDAHLILRQVGVNPTRAAIIDMLQAMGGDIRLFNERMEGGEPVADMEVRSSALRGIEVKPEWVSIAIDEFPILFIAAACAEGETVARDLQELRVKESDRLGLMAAHLSALGVALALEGDTIRIQGSASAAAFSGGRLDSHGDHRIAMSLAVAGLRSAAPMEILDCANVATSFPQFFDLAREIGMELRHG